MFNFVPCVPSIDQECSTGVLVNKIGSLITFDILIFFNILCYDLPLYYVDYAIDYFG